MARKKEVIQKEWDTAQDELVKALDAADKAADDLTLTDKMVEGAQAQYDEWKKLLNESITKIAAWKNEKDKKRLEWMKYVDTQKTKSDRNYVERIKQLWTKAAKVLVEIGVKETMDDLVYQYENNCVPKLKKVSDCVKEAVAAISKKDASVALNRHGAAFNHLKGVTAYATKGGLQKSCGIFAKNHKVAAQDVNLADPTLKKWFDKTVTVYNALRDKLEELEPEIDSLADELANKEPETDSQDPDYKKHLQEIVTDYRDVLAFAKAGTSKTKKLEGDVKKLVTIAERATAEVADKIAATAEKIHGAMLAEYKAVDTHIQQTIRTSSSTVTVKRKNYGITEADQQKTLAPLMDRAFALNFQAKTACENSTDEMRDVLESLVAQFDNAAAKSALSKVAM